MKTVVITGASSGLGKEIIKAALKLCPETEEFWLIARREEKLKASAQIIEGKKVFILPADLTSQCGLDKIKNAAQMKNPEVTYLFNNAGAGRLGKFEDLSEEEQLSTVNLNCIALTAVTKIFLPYMKSGSKIVNTCSIASFAPTPNMAVYGAAKAYVLSLTYSLRAELKEKGIGVNAVCPGPMDTEFLPVAGIHGNSVMFEKLPYCDPKKVALGAVYTGKYNLGVYTPSLIYKLYRIIAKIIPQSLLVYITKC